MLMTAPCHLGRPAHRLHWGGVQSGLHIGGMGDTGGRSKIGCNMVSSTHRRVHRCHAAALWACCSENVAHPTCRGPRELCCMLQAMQVIDYRACIKKGQLRACRGAPNGVYGPASPSAKDPTCDAIRVVECTHNQLTCWLPGCGCLTGPSCSCGLSPVPSSPLHDLLLPVTV